MSIPLVLGIIDRTLAFQDSREPKYRADESETASPLLPDHWLTYADLRAIQSALNSHNELDVLRKALRAVLDDWTIAADESGMDNYEVKDVSVETVQKVVLALAKIASGEPRKVA